MRYAAGRKAFGFSDRSGHRYPLNEMRTEWNGFKVGADEYEEKHPQLDPPRVTPDAQALRDPRPEKRTVPATVALGLPTLDNPRPHVFRILAHVGVPEVVT